MIRRYNVTHCRCIITSQQKLPLRERKCLKSEADEEVVRVTLRETSDRHLTPVWTLLRVPLIFQQGYTCFLTLSSSREALKQFLLRTTALMLSLTLNHAMLMDRWISSSVK